MRGVWAFVILLLGALGFAGWASDFVTKKGERTIYTVECHGGAWKGDECADKLAAGPRYRYRALKPHNEVIFWIVGSKEPSGRLSPCVIESGRNWICKPGGDAARSITLEMVDGAAVAGPAGVTRPFRAVSKWHWILINRGLVRDEPVLHAASKAPSPTD
jgi:hypothetical protein